MIPLADKRVLVTPRATNPTPISGHSILSRRPAIDMGMTHEAS